MLRSFVLVGGLLVGCAGPSRVARTGFEVHTFAIESTNVHVVVKDGAALMFDTGYRHNADELVAALTTAGIAPEQLKAIVVSHAHADHAGAASTLHERFKVPVVLGAGDEGMYASGRNEPLCPTGLIGSLRKSGDESQTYPGSKADTMVESSLDLAASTGIDAVVTRLPGHTAGSLIVTIGDVALVGDLLRGSIVGSGAETHFYQCDLELNRRNVLRVLDELAPKAALFFVGHFGPLTREAVEAHFRK